eukprot:g2101.t1
MHLPTVAAYQALVNQPQGNAGGQAMSPLQVPTPIQQQMYSPPPQHPNPFLDPASITSSCFPSGISCQPAQHYTHQNGFPTSDLRAPSPISDQREEVEEDRPPSAKFQLFQQAISYERGRCPHCPEMPEYSLASVQWVGRDFPTHLRAHPLVDGFGVFSPTDPGVAAAAGAVLRGAAAPSSPPPPTPPVRTKAAQWARDRFSFKADLEFDASNPYLQQIAEQDGLNADFEQYFFHGTSPDFDDHDSFYERNADAHWSGPARWKTPGARRPLPSRLTSKANASRSFVDARKRQGDADFETQTFEKEWLGRSSPIFQIRGKRGLKFRHDSTGKIRHILNNGLEFRHGSQTGKMYGNGVYLATDFHKAAQYAAWDVKTPMAVADERDPLGYLRKGRVNGRWNCVFVVKLTLPKRTEQNVPPAEATMKAKSAKQKTAAEEEEQHHPRAAASSYRNLHQAAVKKWKYHRKRDGAVVVPVSGAGNAGKTGFPDFTTDVVDILKGGINLFSWAFLLVVGLLSSFLPSSLRAGSGGWTTVESDEEVAFDRGSFQFYDPSDERNKRGEGLLYRGLDTRVRDLVGRPIQSNEGVWTNEFATHAPFRVRHVGGKVRDPSSDQKHTEFVVADVGLLEVAYVLVYEVPEYRSALSDYLSTYKSGREVDFDCAEIEMRRAGLDARCEHARAHFARLNPGLEENPDVRKHSAKSGARSPEPAREADVPGRVGGLDLGVHGDFRGVKMKAGDPAPFLFTVGRTYFAPIIPRGPHGQLTEFNVPDPSSCIPTCRAGSVTCCSCLDGRRSTTGSSCATSTACCLRFSGSLLSGVLDCEDLQFQASERCAPSPSCAKDSCSLCCCCCCCGESSESHTHNSRNSSSLGSTSFWVGCGFENAVGPIGGCCHECFCGYLGHYLCGATLAQCEPFAIGTQLPVGKSVETACSSLLVSSSPLQHVLPSCVSAHAMSACGSLQSALPASVTLGWGHWAAFYCGVQCLAQGAIMLGSGERRAYALGLETTWGPPEKYNVPPGPGVQLWDV